MHENRASEEDVARSSIALHSRDRHGLSDTTRRTQRILGINVSFAMTVAALLDSHSLTAVGRAEHTKHAAKIELTVTGRFCCKGPLTSKPRSCSAVLQRETSHRACVLVAALISSLQLGLAVRNAYTFDMTAPIDRRYDRAQDLCSALRNSLSISLLLLGLPLAPG